MKTSRDASDPDGAPDELERETAEALGRWAEARRADVEAARRETTPADRAAAVSTFEALAKGGRSTFRGRWLLVAAALLVGLTLGYLVHSVLGPPADDAPVLLGDGGLSGLIPTGEVDRYDRFSWTHSSDTPSSFGLRVWNEGDLDAVISVDGLTLPEYVPTDEERARLGATIRWEVTVQSSDGSTLGLASSSATRSP